MEKPQDSLIFEGLNSFCVCRTALYNHYDDLVQLA